MSMPWCYADCSHTSHSPSGQLPGAALTHVKPVVMGTYEYT
jgi:hypothetical protein